MMYILKKDNLRAFISALAGEGTVFTPQREEGQVMLLPYNEDSFTMDYTNFAFPVKEHLFKQKEILFSWESKDGDINVETPGNINAGRHVYFGVRPCDVYGIRYMDKFFLEGYRDEFYGRNRAAAIIIAVNCTEAGENCFCSSLGTGPFAEEGYDLLFTPIDSDYIVEAGTEKGRQLVELAKSLLIEAGGELLAQKDKIKREALSTFTNKIKDINVSGVLEKNFDNPLWQELSKDCISCTGCTSLCPTCTCFNVVEESKGSGSGCRVRYWDSCQSDSFTRNAKNHNPRSKEARVRYRIYDKFEYIEDKFGMKGCTGCGRCINVCPAAINIVEIINKLADCSLNVKDCEGK
ncbi:MAG: Heterodisulfide reductase, cytochrome reductase subunit [Clostridia bacterium]|jgi:formate hydrogenlyase subunit 6/NADH:ubiquinone oxidoreductase subunit I|nr:Heterodisulfide reductase, cytochrome reductase subunit [Clostridia bacterium]